MTYHDACHLAHGQKVRTAPRALLARIPGLTVVRLADSDLCCGSAGVYNILEPDMADRLLEHKIGASSRRGARIGRGRQSGLPPADRQAAAGGVASTSRSSTR